MVETFKDHKTAREAFAKVRSGILRHVKGTFYLFTPAYASVGHPTAEVAAFRH